MNKKIFASIIALCLACFVSAQVVLPYGMPYQALVKNADNTVVAEQNVGVHVALLQAGKVVFEETQTVATDANGVLSMVIGDNQLQTIDWSLGGYTLKVEIDPQGGTSYALVTEQGMVSVPYAFYTQNAADAFSRDYKDLKNAPEIPVVPTKISAFENDAKYLSKEAQQLKLDEMTLSITDGVDGVVNSVDLPKGEFDYYNVEGRPLANAQGDMLYWDANAKCWKPITGGENMILTVGLDGTVQWINKDHAAEPEKPCGELIIKDNDNNEYGTVQIGEQCWMKENLKTTKYADGTDITYGSSSVSDAYYYYPNGSDANKDQYGLLYNWAALMKDSKTSEANPSGVRSLCPEGWHIPSLAEFQQLKDAINTPENQCEGDNSTVKALCSNEGWQTSDTKCLPGYEQKTANNKSGFTAMPAGKFTNGRYMQFSQGASFWTSSFWDIPQQPVQSHIYQGINFFYVSMDDTANEADAMSVRCLRD